MRKLYLVLFFIFCGGFLYPNVSAQEKQGANWLFGGRVHIDFNSSVPVVNNFSFNPADTTFSGVASISDKNGKLLFFTSKGILISGKKNNGVYQAMPNGHYYTPTSSQNLISTSAEMIVQSPADSNIYYLFFIGIFNKSTDLYKVQVDMRLNNGFGDVIPNSLQLVRKNVDSFKLTALLHHNNRDTWVMTSNQFKNFRPANTPDTLVAFLLTPKGISPPVNTLISTPLNPSSRLKASPNSEMFAVSAEIRAANYALIQTLQLFDFNRATGVPTLRYALPAPENDYPIFSFAFSPDNSKLYIGNGSYSYLPVNSHIYQYDLLASNAAQVEQSRNRVFHSTTYFGVSDMQLGIDGKLYLYISTSFLSEIKCPNFYGPACNFQLNAVNFNATTRGNSLPTLNQTLFRNAGKFQGKAEQNIICEGDSVQLSAYGAGAEQFKWKAANGLSAASDTLADPVVNPNVTTTYRVIGSSTCHTDTAYVKVTVVPKPKAISVTGPLQAHTFAEKQQYSVQNPVSGSKYTWEVTGGTLESGQGQSSIVVNWGNAGTGIVSVTESTLGGCKGDKVSLPVLISGEPEPLIYNIITPNNDHLNDIFFIENLKWYPQHELKIYNRWGLQVYQTSNYQNNWNAEKLTSGVYYYFFTANGRSWKGWVEVVK